MFCTTTEEKITGVITSAIKAPQLEVLSIGLEAKRSDLLNTEPIRVPVAPPPSMSSLTLKNLGLVFMHKATQSAMTTLHVEFESHFGSVDWLYSMLDCMPNLAYLSITNSIESRSPAIESSSQVGPLSVPQLLKFTFFGGERDGA